MQDRTFIRNTLYEMKKRYSGKIGVYRQTPNVVDTKAGTRSYSTTSYEIGKAIVLPVSIQTKFAYDISYLAANKNFTYGGLYAVGQRVFIIDKRDLSIELLKSDYIIFEHKKYEIKVLEKLDFDLGYIVTAKHLDGELPNEISNQKVRNRFKPGQSVSATVN